MDRNRKYITALVGLLLLIFWCTIVTLYPQTTFGSELSLLESEQLIKQKVPVRVLEKLTDGQFQDLIVEFEQQDIKTEAAERRKAGRLKFNNAQITAFKSDRYRDRKKRLFDVIQNSKLNIIRDYKHLPLTLVRIGNKRALEHLISLPEVKSLHVKTVFYPHLSESLPFIKQSDSFDCNYGGDNSVVAVLDTGVEYGRDAFGNCSEPGEPGCKVVAAIDIPFEDNERDASDIKHGTNVAAIVLGVAPDVRIAAIDVFDGNIAEEEDVLAAIDWVIDQKDQGNLNTVAINLSLGRRAIPASDCISSPSRTAILNAQSAGIMTLASSGNDGFLNEISFPACIPEVVSVGAVYDSNIGGIDYDSNCSDSTSAPDKVTCFSNSSDDLSLLAPGAEISAAGETLYGTSQAAPHVSGAAAILRSAYPADSLDETLSRLQNAGVLVTDQRNNITTPRLSFQNLCSDSENTSIITPSDYTILANPQVGDEYYLDRSYVLNRLPIVFTDGDEELIQTKNNDKSSTSESFLQFTVSQDSTVYVAYDSRATTLPNWLSVNFTLTSLTIGVTDAGMGFFNVFKKDFSAGTISLGGNRAVPASGAGSNYIVIVKPATLIAEICDNSLDDDGDSLIDCTDPDCSTDPACQTCTDADFDNFFAKFGCGTAIDCDDTDYDINPGAAEVCNDNLDNDCDNLIDCNDGDCLGDPACSGGDVTIITPADYTVANLNVGDEYYLDRTYTLTSIPPELATGTEDWIKTANNDKSNTNSSNFFQFTISQDSTVYVAYDSRATSLPNWLSANFTLTSLTVGVSDSYLGHFEVYQQTFTAGTISLGGNRAVPASGAGSNYIVIVKPATFVAEICDNSIDDDGDSLIDCADPDCSTDPACQVCTDDDIDTFFAEPGCGTAIDCDDTDFDINPGAAEVCNDNLDNDCDNLIDCNDGDCIGDPACSGGDVTIISPSAYTVADLDVGDEYYLDRTYTLTSIPPELATGTEDWIKTANNDKSNTTSSNFLQFTISQDSTVYVAYDSRATSLPNWLSGNFSLTSLTVGVSDSYMGNFDVYQQTFTAGTISLGGNRAVPASGAGSNYIVIVKSINL